MSHTPPPTDIFDGLYGMVPRGTRLLRTGKSPTKVVPFEFSTPHSGTAFPSITNESAQDEHVMRGFNSPPIQVDTTRPHVWFIDHRKGYGVYASSIAKAGATVSNYPSDIISTITPTGFLRHVFATPAGVDSMYLADGAKIRATYGITHVCEEKNQLFIPGLGQIEDQFIMGISGTPHGPQTDLDFVAHLANDAAYDNETQAEVEAICATRCSRPGDVDVAVANYERRSESKNNAKYIFANDGRSIAIQLTADVAVGDEITVPYGLEYWIKHHLAL